MISLGKKSCSNCGEKIDRDARYCPICGQPQSGETIQCGNCRKEIRADARFCPYCSEPVPAAVAPRMRENRWSRPEDALAVRVEVDDVQGFWSRKVTVEPGVKAIILADGRNLGVQGPGTYTLENLIEKSEKFLGLRSANKMTAILVDTRPFDMVFGAGGIFTKDPLRVGIQVRLTTQVGADAGEVLKFYTTMLRSRVRFTQEDLRHYLAPEVDNAAQEWIGERTVQDLAVKLDLKRELETHLEVALKRTFGMIGLQLEQVRTMDYNMEHVDRIRKIEEKYLIRTTEADTELAGRRKLFEVMTATELQELAEETKKVEIYERRVKIREQMRQAILSERFGELRDEQKMDKFLREIDREKLIDDDEWDRFKRTLAWRRDDELRQREEELQDHDWARGIEIDDRERDRAHLLARIEIENRYDLQQIDLLQRMDLEPAELEHEQAMARQQLEGDMALEATRQAFNIHQQTQEAEFRRGQQNLDAIYRREKVLEDTRVELDVQLRQAKTGAEIARIEREQDQADAELGILLLEKMKAVRRKDEEERELLRMRIRREEMEMDLIRLQTESEVQMREEAQRQQFELDWMDQLKGMTPSELMVIAREDDRAQLVHDLAQTEAMKGLTEQQILAKAAENSPEAARALAELAKAAAEGGLSAEQVAMYERLLGQTQLLAEQRAAEADRLDRIRREEADRQERMMGKALDSQRDATVDVARATSHGQQPPTVIVTGQGGTQVVGGQAGTAGQVFRCPKCNEVVDEDANFCPNCRHQLRGGSE